MHYEKINRIINNGIAFDHMSNLAKKAGVMHPPTTKTFRNIIKAGPKIRPPQDRVSSSIDKIHYHVFRGKHDVPSSEYTCKIRDNYFKSYLKRDWGVIENIERCLKKNINKNERLLAQNQLDENEINETFGMYWLLLRINCDKVRTYRDDEWEQNLVMDNWKEGKNNLERSLELIELISPKSGIGSNIEYALKINGIALDINRIPTKEKENQPNIVREIFLENEHRKYASILINEEYYQWSPIRNMMIESRFMNDENEFINYFELLVSSYHGFSKLGYSTGLVPPINEDPDMRKYLYLLEDAGFKN